MVWLGFHFFLRVLLGLAGWPESALKIISVVKLYPCHFCWSIIYIEWTANYISQVRMALWSKFHRWWGWMLRFSQFFVTLNQITQVCIVGCPLIALTIDITACNAGKKKCRDAHKANQGVTFCQKLTQTFLSGIQHWLRQYFSSHLTKEYVFLTNSIYPMFSFCKYGDTDWSPWKFSKSVWHKQNLLSPR